MKRAALVFVCALVAGCGWRFPLLPDTRTPADRAGEIVPRCATGADPTSAQAVSPGLVERVDPAYSFVPSGGGVDRAVHIRGARLLLRPAMNVSPEALQRALECHEAEVTLGRAAALQSDPYVLPGSWLDIHVASTGDGLVAAVETNELDDARRVLERARAFAGSRP